MWRYVSLNIGFDKKWQEIVHFLLWVATLLILHFLQLWILQTLVSKEERDCPEPNKDWLRAKQHLAMVTRLSGMIHSSYKLEWSTAKSSTNHECEARVVSGRFCCWSREFVWRMSFYLSFKCARLSNLPRSYSVRLSNLPCRLRGRLSNLPRSLHGRLDNLTL